MKGIILLVNGFDLAHGQCHPFHFGNRPFHFGNWPFHFGKLWKKLIKIKNHICLIYKLLVELLLKWHGFRLLKKMQFIPLPNLGFLKEFLTNEISDIQLGHLNYTNNLITLINDLVNHIVIVISSGNSLA